MKLLRLAAVISFLLFLCPFAHSCIWDRDTLHAETKGVPDIISTISGRFDRYPPKYYEMRRDRILSQIQDNSKDLALYDDLAVSYDRLGDSTTAIEWMAKKKAKLDQSPDKEHEYRYLANLGTFYAHRWLKAGADFSNISDLEKAVELIEKAIELNPDAHFGREKYQLFALQWLQYLAAIERPEGIEGKDFPVEPINFDSEYSRSTKTDPNSQASEAVKGFSGLITLGAAWESYDIFLALANALKIEGRHLVAYLAELRIAEIRAAGKKSLSHEKGALYLSTGSAVMEVDKKEAQVYYQKLRKEAKQWQEKRLAYLEKQFAEGLHPDTHPDFWEGYVEKSSVPTPPHKMNRNHKAILGMAGFGLVCFAGALGVVYLMRRFL